MRVSLPAAVACATLPWLAACVISIGGSSCSWDTIHGSGLSATEVREVPPFRRLELSGSVEIVARAGEPQSLSLTCDDNLLQYVETEVRGDTLHIGMRSGHYSFEHGLEVRLSAPVLEGLALSGSGTVDLSGLGGERFDVAISGSGDVRASGRVERLVVSVSGSGDMDLYGLEAREASVSITGSGTVDIHALESLNAQVSGSGDVRYHGSPKASVHVSGSGSVSQG